jgi:hypothetical protein
MAQEGQAAHSGMIIGVIMPSMIDVSTVKSEAQQIVVAAASVYLRHTGVLFIGLLIQGSALKGSFIQGSSDVDLKLYLDDATFTNGGQLPLSLCLAIQRDLSKIDPAPFRYIQCDVLQKTPLASHVGPVPGTYHVVTGHLPVPEATEEQIQQAAHQALQTLIPVPTFVTDNLLEHGGGRLSATIRLLCTKVWPTLYNVLTLQQNTFTVWRLSKDQAINLIPSDTTFGRAIRKFYSAVLTYYPTESAIEPALDVIDQGVAVLQAADSWYQAHYQNFRSSPTL